MHIVTHGENAIGRAASVDPRTDGHQLRLKAGQSLVMAGSGSQWVVQRGVVAARLLSSRLAVGTGPGDDHLWLEGGGRLRGVVVVHHHLDDLKLWKKHFWKLKALKRDLVCLPQSPSCTPACWTWRPSPGSRRQRRTVFDSPPWSRCTQWRRSPHSRRRWSRRFLHSYRLLQ